MPELLLLSNSTSPGMGFLEHARGDISRLAPPGSRLLFVPYASADYDQYTEIMTAALAPVSVQVTGAHRAGDPGHALAGADAVFVGGGNSFRLLRTLQDTGLGAAIAERVRSGLPYLGSSAGTNMACPTLRTTNDMPITEPASFAALGLIPFQINPHYPLSLGPDPASSHQGETRQGETHQGETRQRRIEEFLEENDVPVLGLREGSWLRVSDDLARTGGTTWARLFTRGAEPRELPPGSDVSDLLATRPRFDVGPA